MLANPRARLSIASGGVFLVVGGGALEGPPPAPVALPPQDFAPPGSVPIYGTGRQQSAGAGSVTLASGTLPDDRVGVLKTLSLVINSPVLATHAQLRLSVNGTPVVGLGAVDVWGRDGASSLELPLDKLRVELPAGASWKLEAVNIDGGTYTMQGSATGWHYARELRQ